MPDNVTKAFREMLDKAIARIGAINKFARAPELSEDEKFAKAGADCCKKIKQKHFPEKKWDMHVAAECGEILASLKRTARQGSPKASDLEIMRIVWGMV